MSVPALIPRSSATRRSASSSACSLNAVTENLSRSAMRCARSPGACRCFFTASGSYSPGSSRNGRAPSIYSGKRLASGFEKRLQPRNQLFVRERQQMLLIEPVELFRVEDGVSAADAFEREPIDQLACRKQLLIAARRPAKQREEVDHGLADVALTLVLHDRRGAMPLAQALLVGSHDERNMRKSGRRLLECLVEQNLFRRVRNVI